MTDNVGNNMNMIKNANTFTYVKRVRKHVPLDGRQREPADPRTGTDRSDRLVLTFV